MTLSERVKDLWELDLDTLEISQIIKIPEGRVYNILSAIRKERYAVKVKNAGSAKKIRTDQD